MKFRQSWWLQVPLVIFIFGGNQVQCLFIIPSMLMAMTGGLLMGKMTMGMGGLLMMLMAANQQQTGQNFLRNLGVIPHPAPSTGISVPTLSTSGSSNEAFTQDLIVRKRRDLNSGKSDGQKPLLVDTTTQYRVMRQVANSDPQNCLPSALCGLSATPPTSQSGFLNDYAYLLTNMFSRDETVDDLDKEFDELMTKPKKKKKKAGNKTKKKEESDLDDESSEEEPSDDEIDEQSRIEDEALDTMLNEEILSKNPDYFTYALRDSFKKKPQKNLPPQRPPDVPPPDFREIPYPGDLSQMSETDLDAVLAQLDGRPPPERRPSTSASGGSLFSRIIPKLSMGFTPSKSDNFANDPFFSGFKRNINRRSLELSKINLRPATAEEEELFQEMRQRRQQRKDYIAQKRKELAEVQDPVEKFRIAAEFGEKLKSPRQCRVLFNSCPFNYTQVLGMVADMRKVIMGEPLSNQDTVVNLKPSTATAASPVKNVINLNAGSMGSGVTSILHELPSGEKVEINLKMTKGGPTQTQIPNRKTGNVLTPSSQVQAGTKKKQNGGQQDLLENKNQQKKNAEPLKSLESLKATMMAIQKINNFNNATVQFQPLPYTHALTDLEVKTKVIKDSDIFEPDIIESDLPEPDPVILTKLLAQNNKQPEKTNNPKITASLLASSLTKGDSKTEDDEAEENMAQIIAGIKRISAAKGAKPNEELAEILARLKIKKTINGKPNTKYEFQDDTTEEEEEEDGDDEEEDEIDDMNSAYNFKSQPMRDDHKTYRVPVKSNRPKSAEIRPVSQLDKRRLSSLVKTLETKKHKVKKPRKLFLGHDIDLPRTLPL